MSVKTKLNPDDFLRVTVQIGAQTFEEDLQAQALIEPNIEAMNEALATNTGLFAKWAMLEARARVQWDAAVGILEGIDADIKDLDAELFLKYQTDLNTNAALTGAKAPTLDNLKNLVRQDAKMKELLEQRRVAAVNVRDTKGTLEYVMVGRKTIDFKKDHLLELARNWRAEMERGLSVKGRTPQGPPPKYNPGPQGARR